MDGLGGDLGGGVEFCVDLGKNEERRLYCIFNLMRSVSPVT
jgi:hypothetical protein